MSLVSESIVNLINLSHELNSEIARLLRGENDLKQLIEKVDDKELIIDLTKILTHMV